MGVDSGGQGGAVAPLDFQTWYKYSKKRLKSAIFRPFLLFFGLFSVGPSWKRLNSAIFRYFLIIFGLFFHCPPPPRHFFFHPPLLIL